MCNTRVCIVTSDAKVVGARINKKGSRTGLFPRAKENLPESEKPIEPSPRKLHPIQNYLKFEESSDVASEFNQIEDFPFFFRIPLRQCLFSTSLLSNPVFLTCHWRRLTWSECFISSNQNGVQSKYKILNNF